MAETTARLSRYSTGFALWNMASVKTLDLGRVGIPQGKYRRQGNRNKG
ncbi:MAG: hypothetical protein ACE10H_16220 [Candidatus Binatia bacterium]